MKKKSLATLDLQWLISTVKTAGSRCCNCSREQSANKMYTRPKIELWTFCIESGHSTTELLRNVIPMLISQLYLKKTVCQEALNKRVFSATLDHWINQLLLDAVF